MRIILTGGGTGGHFYPIIAVAEALNSITAEKRMVQPELIFVSDAPYDSSILLRQGIKFKKTYAGKLRRYFSFWNFIDAFKIPLGVIKSFFSIYFNFPDVIFSKGGYASFPVVLAARVLGIPLIIHESDTVPGKVNSWSGKFAKRIAISFDQTSKYFLKEKTALTGNPIRKSFFVSDKTGAREFFGIKEGEQCLFIIGGSQGSQRLNEIIIDILPELLKKYHVIHQCGSKNLNEVKKRISIVLNKSEFQSHYHLYDFLDESTLRMAYSAADLVLSRASGGGIFEIAIFGAPSILVPLPHAAQDHQKENAYAYAKTGSAKVIEEGNLKPHILLAEIEHLLQNKNELKNMSEMAKKFSKPDSAQKIAKEIINLVLEHSL
ncbi:UDP-N-acetylglucosamine--N-acetylmuramyl-(pentapeptide) pyrophosphoryl-undecaprenol N-acetylglucosamine transferase [Patescibacteria group bacterium]|nr:UDP-N-acetylglucosamine--N-acetylmuramyl-(pentapeptide) pyrophosphoryl-undecaprenol N-acetylglucosamine transferase [Patescibacteria group bacterium]